MKKESLAASFGARVLPRACTSIALGCLVFGASLAWAEGSRSLYPSTYTASRANLDLTSPGSLYSGVVARRTFLYVYAQEGEYILVGSRNRINGNPAGNIRIYNPADFGARGNETIPASSSFDCVGGATGGAPGPHYFGDPDGGGPTPPRGAIADRLQELAGPNSANNANTVPNGWPPCAYRAPMSGIYGVLFAASDGGGDPNGNLGTPSQSSTTVSAWEVQVRANDTTLVDINGRLFTYAFVFFTGGNGRPVSSSIYVATEDGYRYAQDYRGFDPNGYAVYANSYGFLDTHNAPAPGIPLYKDVRGDGFLINPIVPPGTGIVSQAAQYPLFFSDIDPSGPNASEVNTVLTALFIPTSPPLGTLDSVSFAGSTGSGTTFVNNGGTFTMETTNSITFQIVISAGVDYDPGNTANRTLFGLAGTGTVQSVWDGRNNAGVFFPVGNYPYRVTARFGEVHLPLVDAEGNANGGPTVRRLNGPGSPVERRTVYFDDRGYRTRNGTLVGILNGEICGASGPPPPSPDHNLLGVDSAGPNFRRWLTNGNSNADCASATQGFGDAKNLDLWTFIATTDFDDSLEIVDLVADLQVVKSNFVTELVTGSTTTYTLEISNLGPDAADGAVITDTPSAGLVLQSVSCGNEAGGAVCPAGPLLVADLLGPGIAIPTLPDGGSLTFTVMAEVTATGI